jgi:methionyl-tRNA formyltransferase
MRILFMGTSPFALPVLRALHTSSGCDILGVVTQPDRPQGRGGKVSMSPVKQLAMELALPVYQPEKVRAREFVQTVRDLAPDALVVAAFGQIVPQRMLDIAPLGNINVHGSLLPRWRGAAPMQYALMAGDAETGVTTMQMAAGLDTGDILLQASLSLSDDDTLGTLEPKLAELGASLLLDTLAHLAAGDCPRLPQDESLVTLAPSLPPDIGLLDWTRPARDLHNLVRGVTPRPGAYTLWQGRRLKVWHTSLVPATSAVRPGVVESIDAQGILIGTGEGALLLREVQPESKGRMDAAAWARGARVAVGAQWEAGQAPN